MQKDLKESTDTDMLEIDELQIDMDEIEYSPIKNVNSYCVSFDKSQILICTDQGIALVSNHSLKFRCYMKQSSPFWLDKVDLAHQQLSVKIGSLVPDRNEAAVVPNFDSKKLTGFKSTHVYIFDYQMRCILYEVDFFLPIEHISITSSQIYASNSKRVVVYNYRNDIATKNKSQGYYLEQYVSKQPNNKIRYFETMCEDYYDPFTINEIIEVKDEKDCCCGKFKLSTVEPYVMVSIKTFTLNHQRFKAICIYREKYDKEYQFEAIADEEPFDFAISDSGQWLAFTYNYGRNIKIFNIKENFLYCVLYLGRSVSQILTMNFFTVLIEGKVTLCMGVIRRKENSTATLHIFKVTKQTPTSQIESHYKRYFSLFEETFKDYGIASSLINPGIYVHQNILYVFSLCGIVYDAIDFSRSGNRDKKQLQNFNRWAEQKSL